MLVLVLFSYSLVHVIIITILYSVIYDTKASDNEEKSAELFMEFAKECFYEVIWT